MRPHVSRNEFMLIPEDREGVLQILYTISYIFSRNYNYSKYGDNYIELLLLSKIENSVKLLQIYHKS